MRTKISITMGCAIILCMSTPIYAAYPDADLTGDGIVNMQDFSVFASQWLTVGAAPQDITWVDINDSGFNGYMSKYETTNAQFARYLNAALTTGDIIVDGNYVKGADGSNPGEDFIGENYYRLDGPGSTFDGATNGGAARITYTGSFFTVDSGFENHPVTYVSWYGASAFAAYYRWYLPSQPQWEAAGNFDGTYTYGCGTTIDHNLANYRGSAHPHGTTEVGAFGAFGYALADISGNVYEWTSTVADNNRHVAGGSWTVLEQFCKTSYSVAVHPGDMENHFGFRVYRNKYSVPDITWMYIDDGAGMVNAGGDPINEGGFAGYMSKYETTNAQFAQYLNDALVSGDVVVSTYDHPDLGQWTVVKGSNGSNHGEDFVGENYYRLDGPGLIQDGVTNGGAARIDYSYSSGVFAVESGFENHPVTYVSWYGATAFADYYGWRLPTEWEWQAVADFDGSYNYGCGTTINNSIANYEDSHHPYGTTPVGAFGSYGYGMADMAGNVWEWTNSLLNSSGSDDRVWRGGGWDNNASFCTVSNRLGPDPGSLHGALGFRVCR